MNEHWDPEFNERQRAAQRGKRQMQQFVVEQATDPLNYVPFGAAAKGAKLAAKGLFGVAGMQLADEAQATFFRPDRAPKEVMEWVTSALKDPKMAHETIFDVSGMEMKGGKPYRYYVPDNKAVMRSNPLSIGKNGVPISAVFDNPEVFKTLPELKNLKIKLSPELGKDTRAQISLREGTIYLNPAYATDLEQVRKSIIHEIQHYAQFLDGRQHGGSPDQFVPDIIKDLETRGMDVTDDKWWKFARQEAFKRYKKLMGEKEARFSAGMSNVDVRNAPKMQRMDVEEVMDLEAEGLKNSLSDFYRTGLEPTIR